jgi:hypothetical protein
MIATLRMGRVNSYLSEELSPKDEVSGAWLECSCANASAVAATSRKLARRSLMLARYVVLRSLLGYNQSLALDKLFVSSSSELQKLHRQCRALTGKYGANAIELERSSPILTLLRLNDKGGVIFDQVRTCRLRCRMSSLS